MVRSEGLEPPRCYSLPPQGSASTNSATSAFCGIGQWPDRIDGAMEQIGVAWTSLPVDGFDLSPRRRREAWPIYRTSGDLGSICLTSTAIRLRSTRTTPLATGRLFA